ncbi:arginine--tRNA ligase [Candidatus Roizmanbacteria bacterium]|nr:arginine--tRNA ligase [Candidatus Roizmanbacteria bacterium]
MSKKLDVGSLKTTQEKIRFLGKAYSEGQRAYENDEQAKKEIHEINKMVYEQNREIFPLWQETRQWSLDYFKEIYKRVYSHFDCLYFESEMAKKGIEIVNHALKKGILEKSEGAIVFVGKKYGLDIRVFINSLGFPTYEGKELALAEKEFSDFGEIDKCIHLTTPEQSSFFKVTFKVEELLDRRKKDKQYHLMYEWVNLKGGKMSSREGNVIEADWLIDEAKKKIIGLFKCSDDIAETLAIAAVKYSFLKNGVLNQIAFDFDESISIEGNSGPYLLYTYVRAQSILRKGNVENNVIMKAMNKDEKKILQLIYRFSSVVEKSAINFSPNYIATYLFELAQQFNLFYQKHPVLKADEETKNFRLFLTKAVGNVLKKGLDLLGIKTVEKM